MSIKQWDRGNCSTGVPQSGFAARQ